MAKKFEDLIIWRQSRKLANRCLDLVELEPLKSSWPIRNQLVSAGLSTMNNIAEGFERGGNQEFKHFLAISKASAGEVRSMFYLFFDRNWLSAEQLDDLLSQTNHLAAGIRKLIQHLQKSEFGGVNRGDVIRDGLEDEIDELPAVFFSGVAPNTLTL